MVEKSSTTRKFNSDAISCHESDCASLASAWSRLTLFLYPVEQMPEFDFRTQPSDRVRIKFFAEIIIANIKFLMRIYLIW